MDLNRIHYLNSDWNAKLTQEEFDDGWHWCLDWDLLLIHPTMPEWEHCYCHPLKDKTE